MNLCAETLASAPLPNERARSTDTSSQNDNGYQSDPISAVLREIAEEFGGDCLMATWHEREEPPACMTWHGGHPPRSDIATEMLAAACLFAGSGDQLKWCKSIGGPGGIAVMSFPVEGGAVAVTVSFSRIENLHSSLAHGGSAQRRRLLEPFFRLWVQHLRSSSRADGLVSAIDRLDVATFHFDDQGRLLFGNEAGKALLAAHGGLRRSKSSLSGATLADTVALQSAIEDAAQAGVGASLANRECAVVAMTRSGGRPLLAAVAATGASQAGNGAAAVVVYVVDPDQQLLSRLKPVCKLYNLSPVETKLACLLADGSSLSEAARQIDVREQTARSYLKQIFVKTRTIRQGELVGLLLKSSIVTVLDLPLRAAGNLLPSFGGARISQTGAAEF